MYNNDNGWQGKPPTYNNDNGWQGRPPIPDYEKINRKSVWQRYRWIIISAVSVVLVLFFASTTFYLLLNRPTHTNTTVVVVHPTQAGAVPTTDAATPTQAATDQPSLSATPISATSQPTTNLGPTSANYQFICLGDCNNKVGVTLLSINVNQIAQTMLWNFNITNNGNCSGIRGMLSLESPTGETIAANGGTFTESNAFNSGQMLPRTATFSTIPKHNTSYTVSLQMHCDYANTDSYQSVLFNY